MRFTKYHGLGNDYLVVRPQEVKDGLTPDKIKRICHRHYGVGGDGILWGPLESTVCDFKLRIFNPDGSEAEKSGNGLRIFARSLWDDGLVSEAPFTVETLGGVVTCEVQEGGKQVKVQMGRVSFNSVDIPVAGPARAVLREEVEVDGERLTYCAATVGNPHCVVLVDEPTPEMARHYGPLLEVDSRFPHRTNVQFMQVLDRNNIRIEIWERGAGYTLASGSSSTASASVAYRLGLCEGDIQVHMPGGQLRILISDDFETMMIGPVEQIYRGVVDF